MLFEKLEVPGSNLVVDWVGGGVVDCHMNFMHIC